MDKPDIGTSAFSLLDLVAYLFPGAILLSGVALFQPQLLSLVAEGTFQSAALLIVASYTAGFLGVATFWLVLFPIVTKLTGRRLEAVVESSRRFGIHLSPAFNKALEVELMEAWGPELFNAGKRDLVFLCWECVQSEGHPSTTYIKRLTTLFNMAGSLVVAIPALSAGLFVRHQVALGVLTVPAWLIAWGAFFAFRRQFAEKVLRLFFVLSKMGRFKQMQGRETKEEPYNPTLHRTSALSRDRRR